MRAQDVRIVLVTTPDVETARTLARALVEERLVACGNIVPGVVSVYRWQGAVREEGEALLVLKSSDAHLRALTDRVTELHPYDVPEVLALGIERGNQPYLEWLGDCLSPGGRTDGT